MQSVANSLKTYSVNHSINFRAEQPSPPRIETEVSQAVQTPKGAAGIRQLISQSYQSPTHSSGDSSCYSVGQTGQAIHSQQLPSRMSSEISGQIQRREDEIPGTKHESILDRTRNLIKKLDSVCLSSKKRDQEDKTNKKRQQNKKLSQQQKKEEQDQEDLPSHIYQLNKKDLQFKQRSRTFDKSKDPINEPYLLVDQESSLIKVDTNPTSFSSSQQQQQQSTKTNNSNEPSYKGLYQPDINLNSIANPIQILKNQPSNNKQIEEVPSLPQKEISSPKHNVSDYQLKNTCLGLLSRGEFQKTVSASFARYILECKKQYRVAQKAIQVGMRVRSKLRPVRIPRNFSSMLYNFTSLHFGKLILTLRT